MDPRLHRLFLHSCILCVLAIGRSNTGAEPIPALPPSAVKPAIAPTVKPFDLSEVKLLDSPFRKAMNLNARYLLSLEPDRFLHYFRVNAGLKPKGPPYGGWE